MGQGQKETLEVLARLTDTNIEVRDFVDKWILLTYDLPHTKVGDKARRDFLDKAYSIGATRHTDSVYLMPWTPVAEGLALQLARIGDVVVWTSSASDENRARQLTHDYDANLKPMFDEIAERMDRIAEHEAKKHYKRAEKMREKTEVMLAGLQQAAERRGSADLILLGTIMGRRLASL